MFSRPWAEDQFLWDTSTLLIIVACTVSLVSTESSLHKSMSPLAAGYLIIYFI